MNTPQIRWLAVAWLGSMLALPALADDIRRYLDDEPVSAGAPSRLYRVSKFVRRNELAVVASTAVLLGLVAGVIGMGVYPGPWVAAAQRIAQTLF